MPLLFAGLPNPFYMGLGLAHIIRLLIFSPFGIPSTLLDSFHIPLYAEEYFGLTQG